MQFFYFTISLMCSYFLVQFGNADENDFSLVIQRTESELQYAKVVPFLSGEFAQFKSTHKNLLYLCPDVDKGGALNIATRIQENYGPPFNICKNPVEPSIFRVKELKHDHVHLYHIGFTINDAEFKDIPKPTEYELIIEGYHFIPMISVYRDIESQLTSAVKYDIIRVDTKKKSKIHPLTYIDSNLFSNKVEELYRNQESKLSEILGVNYDKQKYTLDLGSLVYENDFIIDTWKKTARYKVLQILIWKNNLSTWRDIQEFVRFAANLSRSHTTINSGIGKALTITDSNGDKRKLEWGQGKDTVFIPELYWTAIEFTRNDKTTGMFVIINNVPTTDENNMKKICDQDLCEKNHIWHITKQYEYLKGHIYCCPIDIKTIKKLDITFLLEKRDIYKGTKNYSFPTKWNFE